MQPRFDDLQVLALLLQPRLCAVELRLLGCQLRARRGGLLLQPRDLADDRVNLLVLLGDAGRDPGLGLPNVREL